MAMHDENPALPPDLAKKVFESKLLMVGAGGIGCELLKNLVLAGFKEITIIDLDTIDVTNLNRQFLFQKKHVGMSKSKVAKESALEFAPDAKVESIHDSIMKPEYGVTFFKGFNLVLNALDNRAARSHVNRMCLAAEVPLVESGTAGYLGQVTVIRKGITECYECTPKPHQKSFPGCTIRNTPSEPIHCIVWSKHLYNQLFGESDPDEEVSPDSHDPEANAGEEDKGGEETNDGNVARVSTRQWVMDHGYDPKMIFTKLFKDDIDYLLSMDKLWTKRRPPTPLDWDNLPTDCKKADAGAIHDQIPWSIRECAEILATSIGKLKAKLAVSDFKDHLVWDKDDEEAMDFVAACANIRAYVFNIPQKTRFDIKSMAGNIIPAIATTNAVIAGGIVMEALKILNGQPEKCKTVYLTRKPNPRNKILVPCELNKPNPKCYVCSDKHQIGVQLDLEKVTLKVLEERILKGELNMVAPDAEIDGKGVILISSEEETDTSANHEKPLKEFGLADGSILTCDDFLQDYSIKVILYHKTDLEDGVEFELVGDLDKLEANKKALEEAKESEQNKPDEASDKNGHQNGNGDASNANGNNDRKRAATDNDQEQGLDLSMPSKKAKLVEEQDDDDIVCLE